VELYLHSPIRLHGVVLRKKEEEEEEDIRYPKQLLDYRSVEE
jgi:hypothetical protein